jgi:hypothetical protein
MLKLIKLTKKRMAKMEHGQVLVVVAFAIVGLVAIIGLALDVGTMFIEYARLRRAVDSASLAAAVQIREGYDPAELTPAAVDFLKLNGIQTTSVLVEHCDLLTNTPADLCPDPPRKLVRVTAAANAQLNFLAVIGINSVPIVATATSETASIDLVLVIDRSESMTYDYAVGQIDAMGRQMRDPSVCNTVPSPHTYTDMSGPHAYTGYCQPFDTVKDSAIQFVNKFMFEPYDRVAVVSFAKDPVVNLHFSTDKSLVIKTIAELTVFEGDETVVGGAAAAIYPIGNPSRYYESSTGNYLGLNCPSAFIPNDASNPTWKNPKICTTTNIGGGLQLAGREFSGPEPVRLNSLWVVVLLTDGVANAGYDDLGDYYCPDGTWFGQGTVPFLCNDAISTTRHASSPPPPPPSYDSEDYAYDMADFVGKAPPAGQGAYLYTIGLGPQVTLNSTVDGTPLGQIFLTYAAGVGNGVFYDAPTAGQLALIFQALADNIATVLTK